MAAIGGFDRQHGFDDYAPPDEWQGCVATKRQEWQASVNAYEDGLTAIEPVEWKEFWGQ